ncbi:hypothetical protein QS306_00510 [Paraburkholderia bonniea]|uniref:hypothetical protein n=1 Tax=Paraburkholderia bonniea TaxID=2152891 RepID=UPI002572C0CC|nr:hypothetical protein [Paraburkholderia bonniea]WJF90209.1 hypothetical protein QS306_00510 [Paraburkholderia bonniea]WJF93523.1 hypothetical protein QS308_00510 [Paraburkholderia bonniea]
MSPRTSEELEKIQIRSVALMRLLMRKTDTSNANQFAKWLTDRTKEWGWSDMQESKKWYPFVRGKIKRAPIGALKLLSQLFADADDLYWSGPADIWSALWGPLSEQVTILRRHPKCVPKDPLSIVIKKIEESVSLCAEGQLEFEDFVRAVALYGYLAAADSYGRTCDGDGFGHAYKAYCLVQTSYRDPAVADELKALGIYAAIRAELTAIELRRAGTRPAWVSFLECGAIRVDDPEHTVRERNRVAFWKKWMPLKQPPLEQPSDILDELANRWCNT